MLFGDHLCLVRGGGDLGTGVVLRLHRAGFPVAVCELAEPLAVRRTVAVSTAVTDGEITVDGRRIRAVVQNRDLAETSGISSRRTDITTFFIGSGLAGVAGVALTLIGSTSPTIGQSYLIDAFLVVVVGGLGQIKGTVIAAFALGFLNSFIEYNTTASLAKVIVFVVIVIFLQVRPQGLFTVRTRSLV